MLARFPAPRFRVATNRPAGGVGLHQSSGDAASRGYAEHGLIREDHNMLPRPAVLAEVAGCRESHCKIGPWVNATSRPTQMPRESLKTSSRCQLSSARLGRGRRLALAVRATPGRLKRASNNSKTSGPSVLPATSADARSPSEAQASVVGSPIHPALPWASTILGQGTTMACMVQFLDRSISYPVERWIWWERVWFGATTPRTSTTEAHRGSQGSS